MPVCNRPRRLRHGEAHSAPSPASQEPRDPHLLLRVAGYDPFSLLLEPLLRDRTTLPRPFQQATCLVEPALLLPVNPPRTVTDPLLIPILSLADKFGPTPLAVLAKRNVFLATCERLARLPHQDGARHALGAPAHST
jgi:hypothetical protein